MHSTQHSKTDINFIKDTAGFKVAEEALNLRGIAIEQLVDSLDAISDAQVQTAIKAVIGTPTFIFSFIGYYDQESTLGNSTAKSLFRSFIKSTVDFAITAFVTNMATPYALIPSIIGRFTSNVIKNLETEVEKGPWIYNINSSDIWGEQRLAIEEREESGIYDLLAYLKFCEISKNVMDKVKNLIANELITGIEELYANTKIAVNELFNNAEGNKRAKKIALEIRTTLITQAQEEGILITNIQPKPKPITSKKAIIDNLELKTSITEDGKVRLEGNYPLSTDGSTTIHGNLVIGTAGITGAGVSVKIPLSTLSPFTPIMAAMAAFALTAGSICFFFKVRELRERFPYEVRDMNHKEINAVLTPLEEKFGLLPNEIRQAAIKNLNTAFRLRMESISDDNRIQRAKRMYFKIGLSKARAIKNSHAHFEQQAEKLENEAHNIVVNYYNKQIQQHNTSQLVAPIKKQDSINKKPIWPVIETIYIKGKTKFQKYTCNVCGYYSEKIWINYIVKRAKKAALSISDGKIFSSIKPLIEVKDNANNKLSERYVSLAIGKLLIEAIKSEDKKDKQATAIFYKAMLILHPDVLLMNRYISTLRELQHLRIQDLLHKKQTSTLTSSAKKKNIHINLSSINLNNKQSIYNFLQISQISQASPLELPTAIEFMNAILAKIGFTEDRVRLKQLSSSTLRTIENTLIIQGDIYLQMEENELAFRNFDMAFYLQPNSIYAILPAIAIFLKRINNNSNIDLKKLNYNDFNEIIVGLREYFEAEMYKQHPPSEAEARIIDTFTNSFMQNIQTEDKTSSLSQLAKLLAKEQTAYKLEEKYANVINNYTNIPIEIRNKLISLFKNNPQKIDLGDLSAVCLNILCVGNGRTSRPATINTLNLFRTIARDILFAVCDALVINDSVKELELDFEVSRGCIPPIHAVPNGGYTRTRYSGEGRSRYDHSCSSSTETVQCYASIDRKFSDYLNDNMVSDKKTQVSSYNAKTGKKQYREEHLKLKLDQVVKDKIEEMLKSNTTLQSITLNRQNYYNIATSSNDNQRTPKTSSQKINKKLLMASINNETDKALKLLDKGASLHEFTTYKTAHGWNSLHWAAFHGNEKLIKAITKHYPPEAISQTSSPYFWRSKQAGYNTPRQIAEKYGRNNVLEYL